MVLILMCRTRAETDKVGYKLSTKSHAMANNHRVRQANINTDQNFVLIFIYLFILSFKKAPPPPHEHIFGASVRKKRLREPAREVHQVRSVEVSARGSKASNATETVSSG